MQTLMLKVCIKDYRAWEHRQEAVARRKVEAGGHTADANSQRIQETGLKPAKPNYTVKKVGNSYIALNHFGTVIAIEVTKAAAADQAEASFLPVATAAVSGMKNYVLNHTYRLTPKNRKANWSDVIAQDLHTAMEVQGITSDMVELVRVWKSSGKIGTGGSVSSGWSKCTEAMEKPKKKLAAIGFNDGDDESP